jgi:hypothetical protein
MSNQVQQAPPGVVQQTTVIHVGSRKSVVGAVLLALLFGPLGMLYSTVVGALVMFFVNIVVGVATLGLGLIVTVPLGAIWAGIAAGNHNDSLGTMATQAVAQPTAAPAGWHPDPEGSNRLRYWDGSRWTDDFQDGTAALPAGGGEEAKATFCESCGEKVGEADKFCPACGVQQKPIS